MKDVKSLKKGVAVIYIALLVYSGFTEFYGIPELGAALTSFQIKGFYVVLATGIFYVYSVFTNKKSLSLIALVGNIVGYIITIIAMQKAQVGISDCSIGAYEYFGSFILFIGSLLIPSDNLLASEISKMSKEDNKTGEQLNVNGSYFVCSYITGVKKAQNIYKSPSVLIIKDGSNTLDVNIKAPEEIKISIDNNNIEKIIINKEMKVSVSDVQKEDTTVETQYLATVLIGSFGPIVGERLAKNGGASTKAKFDTYYKIEILYKTEEENRLVFRTNADPKEFFKKYENILEIRG